MAEAGSRAEGSGGPRGWYEHFGSHYVDHLTLELAAMHMCGTLSMAVLSCARNLADLEFV